MLICFAVASCKTTQSTTSAKFDPSYNDWNTLLARMVTADGNVDYDGLQKRPELLDSSLAQMRGVTREQFDSWPANQRLPFLVNAHNASAIARIIRHYPVPSLEKTQFFGSAREVRDIRLLGGKWSLHDLVDEVMSDRYLDSRAIFLVNWAEAGCAPLPPVAVTDRNLADLLERQTRRFLADPAHCQYDIRRKVVYLSPLLNQYEKILIRDYTTRWVFLTRYLPSSQASEVKRMPPRIRWLDFDGSLNDANLKPIPVDEAATGTPLAPSTAVSP